MLGLPDPELVLVAVYAQVALDVCRFPEEAVASISIHTLLCCLLGVDRIPLVWIVAGGTLHPPHTLLARLPSVPGIEGKVRLYLQSLYIPSHRMGEPSHGLVACNPALEVAGKAHLLDYALSLLHLLGPHLRGGAPVHEVAGTAHPPFSHGLALYVLLPGGEDGKVVLGLLHHLLRGVAIEAEPAIPVPLHKEVCAWYAVVGGMAGPAVYPSVVTEVGFLPVLPLFGEFRLLGKGNIHGMAVGPKACLCPYGRRFCVACFTEC